MQSYAIEAASVNLPSVRGEGKSREERLLIGSRPSQKTAGIVLDFTDQNVTLAECVARVRLRGHTKRRPEYDRGNAQRNWRGELAGGMGEVCVRLEFQRLGIPATFSDIVEYDPTPDITLPDGRTLDVKTTEGTYLCINERAHYKTRATYYLPVLIRWSGIHIMRPIHRAELSRQPWGRREDRHSPYLSVHTNCLQPLTDWTFFQTCKPNGSDKQAANVRQVAKGGN